MHRIVMDRAASDRVGPIVVRPQDFGNWSHSRTPSWFCSAVRCLLWVISRHAAVSCSCPQSRHFDPIRVL